MDFLNDKIKPMYLKYLSAAFGSALITSIYSVVDMAMVGQYQGPSGTAALAVVAPIWNIIYSLGLLMGIGGSVLFSTARGDKTSKTDENRYFTVSVIGSVILAVIAWVAIILFDRQIFTFFGADPSLLPLAEKYIKPIKYVFPLFLFNQMLSAFIRNDKNPGLATFGVLSGGIFNMIGDYLFVFTFDMGIFGAGLATAIGSVISFFVLITHFFTKKNTLKLVKTDKVFKIFCKISITGFSTFFIDIAMGILTVLFNRQIMKYLDANALAIYGPIINISTFVQCCAYSIGQAAQPIISTNYGAEKKDRIKETLKYSIYTAFIMGIIWTVLCESVPNTFIKIFMTPTEEILMQAPAIVRAYAVSFILLPFNIFSTYYFQAIM
ncbi:MAG: MATE family efflux transporter, partial [Clostridia bacterium]|nr:MATE family efflux transporter [Clostridia bacterium]